MPPGRIIGEILDALLEAVTNDPAPQRARARSSRGPRAHAAARAVEAARSVLAFRRVARRSRERASGEWQFVARGPSRGRPAR